VREGCVLVRPWSSFVVNNEVTEGILTSSQVPKQFFYSLDAIRGIAAILVMLRHTEPFWGVVSFQESYLAVDVFFLMSGVVICQAYEYRLQSGLSVPGFTWIRVVRIYPLYVLGSSLTIMATLLGINIEGGVEGHFFLFLVLGFLLLPNPGLGQPTFLFPFDHPAWSLFSELVINILYAVILRFLTARVLTSIMLISALGMAASIYLSHLHDLNAGWTFKGIPAGFFRVGYSFFAGVLLYRWFKSQKHVASISWYAPLIPWLVLVGVTELLMSAPPITIAPYFDFIAVIAIFPAIIYLGMLFQPAGKSAQICKFLGETSFAVYVLHSPIAHLIQGILHYHNVASIENYAPWVGFCFIILLLPICWLLDKFYDWPVRRFLLSLRPHTHR